MPALLIVVELGCGVPLGTGVVLLPPGEAVTIAKDKTAINKTIVVNFLRLIVERVSCLVCSFWRK